MTISGVRSLERRGVLRPRKEGARHVFDEGDIAAAAKALLEHRGPGRPLSSSRAKLSSGELAALVFEAFDQKKTLPEIVQLHRIDPGEVRRLWQEYVTPLTKSGSQRRRKK